MSKAVPNGGVRFREDGDRLVGQIEFGDKVLEKGEGGKRIIQGIVPGAGGGVVGEAIESERSAEIAKGVGRLIRPGRAGELEGVDPWAEGVAGEGAEEAFFGAMPVSNDRATTQLFFEGGPKREQGGCVAEVVSADAVDLAGGPGDRLIALEKRNDGFVNVLR